MAIPRMVSAVITQRLMSGREGISYITSNTFLDDGAQARASAVLERLFGGRGQRVGGELRVTPSRANSRWNCLTMAFLGSVRILTRVC
jgi:hypothetical protein